MDAKILALNGVRSPDRPACSESPYRLSYPGPHYYGRNKNKIKNKTLQRGNKERKKEADKDTKKRKKHKENQINKIQR